MIDLVLAAHLIAAPGPYQWRMSCEQTLDALATLEGDEWFNRPENKRHKANLRRKLRAHGPSDCVPFLV